MTLLHLVNWRLEYCSNSEELFGPSELDIVSWRTSFQLAVLASFIALLVLWRAPIHSYQDWWIVRRRQFRVQILAHMFGLDFLFGFDFPS